MKLFFKPSLLYFSFALLFYLADISKNYANEQALDNQIVQSKTSHQEQNISPDSKTETQQDLLIGSSKLKNGLITLSFSRAPIQDVFRVFAKLTKLNFILSSKVEGECTIQLENIEWQKALKILLETHHLSMKSYGQVKFIYTFAELREEELQKLVVHEKIEAQTPLKSEIFYLNYPRAEDIGRLLLAGNTEKVLSKRGKLFADNRVNILFIEDIPEKIAQIKPLIKALDRPVRQVLIEAKIIEGDQGFSQNLGARLGIDVKIGDQQMQTQQNDFAARPLSGFAAATAGLALFSAQTTPLLNFELSALASEGKGEIVSSPRVVTANRIKAIIEQGSQIPYQSQMANGASNVQFHQATLKLEVEPQITPEGNVILDLEIAKDSVGETTAAGPAIHTKHVKTRVEVENGGTVSIGGIYESIDREDDSGVPFLRSIPLLGALFRHRSTRRQHYELVIFITPTII